MSKKSKQQERKISPWTRIGALTLTTFSSIISAIRSRLSNRKKQESQRRKLMAAPRERLAEMSKELSQRSRQVRQALSKRSNPFVVVAGFGVGLLATAFTAFTLFRKRKQQEQAAEEEPHIELTPSSLPSEQEAKE
jgi:histidine ammonia-lyase